MKKIYETDPWLEPFKGAVDSRHSRILEVKEALVGKEKISSRANNHLYYGLHRTDGGWVFREWAPNATRIYLIGQFNNWKRTEAYALKPTGNGNWELSLPSLFLNHGDLYKLWIEWPGGAGERIPSYATRVVQDSVTKIFAAQVWDAPAYKWEQREPKQPIPRPTL